MGHNPLHLPYQLALRGLNTGIDQLSSTFSRDGAREAKYFFQYIKKIMKTCVLAVCLVLSLVIPYQKTNAQGCVAIRGGGAGLNSNFGSGLILSEGEFFAGTNLRYFRSFRHFRGREEEKYRVENGTEVINNSHFLDFSLTYAFADRWFATAVLPFAFHHRTSMYEHGGNPPNGLGQRHATNSSGLADARLSVGRWLMPSDRKSNLAVGFGVKMPSGKFDCTGNFYNQGPERNETRVAVLDQSIQLGDGGWGFSLDLQGYHALSPSLLLTGSFFYMSNPAATNGVLIRNGSAEFSCPDQYALRAGTFYVTGLKGLSLYLGGSWEGVPAEDLIGSSIGYRRPGYSISVEPGINYAIGNVFFGLNVPIAVERNRTQSVMDKQRSQETGRYTHGDAAFADYLLNFNVTYRFGKPRHKMPMNQEG
jgi:hypothetical protein